MLEKENFLTSSEAAKLLGVTRMTIGRWIKSGRLVATKIGGRTFIQENEAKRLAKETAPSAPSQSDITKAVQRAVTEYGDVLKRLSRE